MGRASRLKKERREDERREIRRIRELDDRPLLVFTSLGTSILSGDSQAYVRIEGNQYVKKSVSDLKEGDEVIYAKEGICIREQREKMDYMLMQKRDYRDAMSSLFEQAADGFQPKFRVQLLHGILERTCKWPSELTGEPDLIRRVINKEVCLPYGLAELVAEAIHAKLLTELSGTGIHIVSIPHIREGWMEGTVIVPKNFKEVFHALGDISPGLLNLAASKNFEQDYHVYLAMRISLSLRLTSIMEGNAASGKRAAPNHQSYLDLEKRMQIDEIVRNFGDSIDENYKIAAVVKVEPIKRTHEIEAQKNAQPLRKGVLTKKPDDLEIELLTPNEVLKMLAAITGPADWVGGLYTSVKNIQGKEVDHAVLHLLAKLGYETLRDGMHWSAKKMDKGGLDRIGWGDEYLFPSDENAQNIAGQIYNSLVSGELDGYLGLGRGSLLKIVKTYGKINSAEPRELVYLIALGHLKSHYERLGRDASKVEREIEFASKILNSKGYAHEYMTPASFWSKQIRSSKGLLGKLTGKGLLDLEDMAGVILGDEEICDRAFRKVLAATPSLFEPLKDYMLFGPEVHEFRRKLGVLEITEKIMEEQRKSFPHIPSEIKARFINKFYK